MTHYIRDGGRKHIYWKNISCVHAVNTFFISNLSLYCVILFLCSLITDSLRANASTVLHRPDTLTTKWPGRSSIVTSISPRDFASLTSPSTPLIPSVTLASEITATPQSQTSVPVGPLQIAAPTTKHVPVVPRRFNDPSSIPSEIPSVVDDIKDTPLNQKHISIIGQPTRITNNTFRNHENRTEINIDINHEDSEPVEDLTADINGSNCTDGDPCSRRPVCVLTENVSCTRDSKDPCKARYFSRTDGSEVLCNPNEQSFCEFEEVDISCPPRWSVKVWFAMFGPAPDYICPSTTPTTSPPLTTPRTTLTTRKLRHHSNAMEDKPAKSMALTIGQSPCATQSVLWEIARLCDGSLSCQFNVTHEVLGLGDCTERSKIKFLRLEYTCMGSSQPNFRQTRFFILTLAGILALFLFTLTVLFVTVHFKKKKKKESYPMNSVHAPLTDYENPQI